jgi:hypothetical protein
MTSEPLKGETPAEMTLEQALLRVQELEALVASLKSPSGKGYMVPRTVMHAERDARKSAEDLAASTLETCRQLQAQLEKMSAALTLATQSNKVLTARVRELEAAAPPPQAIGLRGAGVPSLLTLGTSLADLGKMHGLDRKPS